MFSIVLHLFPAYIWHPASTYTVLYIRYGEEFVDTTDFEDSDANSESKTKQVRNALSSIILRANNPLTVKVRFNSYIKYSLRIDSDKIEESNEK